MYPSLSYLFLIILSGGPVGDLQKLPQEPEHQPTYDGLITPPLHVLHSIHSILH